MNHLQKLEDLMTDILLLDSGEFHLGLTRDDVETWDSLATVSIAVGLHETFGHHPTPEEAMTLASIGEIITWLESKGLSFDQASALACD